MQISNSFLVVCVAAAACVVVVSCARDTDAHAKIQAPKALEAQPQAEPKAEASDKAAAQPQAGNEAAKADKVMAATQSQVDKAAKDEAKAQTNTNLEERKASLPKGPLAFKPLEAPPSAVSVEKQQKLSDLLRKYKADEVTPEQYHEQRAKILAEP
ncbi:MAG: hypothetical protein ABSH34_30145 [Verrucomicrobiota bacterium]|jgi:hypothetical protein